MPSAPWPSSKRPSRPNSRHPARAFKVPQATAGPFSWQQQGLKDGARQIRITSYNVCYTKLLRRRLDWFPRSLRHRVRQLEEAIHKIENDKGRVPTEEELQEATGLDEKEVRVGLEALQNQLCLSLDAIQETFSTEGRESIDGEPFQATALQELIERVASLIDQLTPREKLVLSLYYIV